MSAPRLTELLGLSEAGEEGEAPKKKRAPAKKPVQKKKPAARLKKGTEKLPPDWKEKDVDVNAPTVQMPAVRPEPKKAGPDPEAMRAVLPWNRPKPVAPEPPKSQPQKPTVPSASPSPWPPKPTGTQPAQVPPPGLPGSGARARMTNAVRKYLGTGDLASVMSAAVASVGGLLDSSDEASANRVVSAFEKAMAAGRLINSGKTESVNEAVSALDRWIERNAEEFVGISNEAEAEKILRSLLKGLPRRGRKPREDDEDEPQAPKKHIYSDVPSVPQQQSQRQSQQQIQPTGAQPQAPQAQIAKDPKVAARSIRDQLLQGVPDVRHEPGLSLARASVRMAQHLATHPASNPEKVKAFVSAWQGFTKELSKLTVGKTTRIRNGKVDQRGFLKRALGMESSAPSMSEVFGITEGPDVQSKIRSMMATSRFKDLVKLALSEGWTKDEKTASLAALAAMIVHDDPRKQANYVKMYFFNNDRPALGDDEPW